MIVKFNEFFLFEKLGVNAEVEKLTEYILNNLVDKDIIVLTENLPKLSFKLKKIIIDFNIEYGLDASFDNGKSKRSGELYFHFDRIKISKDLIQHECLHAFHFMKLELKKTQDFLDKLNNLHKSNKNNNDKLKDFILLYYYSSNYEISAIVHEFNRKIESYVNKENFYDILKNSEEYYISKKLESIDLNKLFDNVSDSELNLFFSTFENYETKKSPFSFIKDFFIKKKYVKRNININNKTIKYQKYFNNQGEYMYRKLTKLYGLL